MKTIRKFFFSEPKALLRQFKVPALLVFGEHELLYDPWKVARRAEKIIPGIETDVVKGAGHAAIYDKPEIVNELVVEYLQKA